MKRCRKNRMMIIKAKYQKREAITLNFTNFTTTRTEFNTLPGLPAKSPQSCVYCGKRRKPTTRDPQPKPPSMQLQEDQTNHWQGKTHSSWPIKTYLEMNWIKLGRNCLNSPRTSGKEKETTMETQPGSLK